MDLSQPALKTSEFYEILWRLHILNGFNHVGIKMDSFRYDNESMEFAT